MRSFSWRASLSILALVLGATVVGLLALWPDERMLEPAAGRLRAKTESAEVVATPQCPAASPGAAAARA